MIDCDADADLSLISFWKANAIDSGVLRETWDTAAQILPFDIDLMTRFFGFADFTEKVDPRLGNLAQMPTKAFPLYRMKHV